MNRFEIFQLTARLREEVETVCAALEELAVEKKHVPKRDRAAYMRLWRASRRGRDGRVIETQKPADPAKPAAR